MSQAEFLNSRIPSPGIPALGEGIWGQDQQRWHHHRAGNAAPEFSGENSLGGREREAELGQASRTPGKGLQQGGKGLGTAKLQEEIQAEHGEARTAPAVLQ